MYLLMEGEGTVGGGLVMASCTTSNTIRNVRLYTFHRQAEEKIRAHIGQVWKNIFLHPSLWSYFQFYLPSVLGKSVFSST